MAVITIGTFPLQIHTGEEIEIVGTNFEAPDGAEPVLTVKFDDTDTEINATYFRVESSTVIRIGVPTLYEGWAGVIEITNASGTASTGENVTSTLMNTGVLLTQPDALKYDWTTEPLENTGKLITSPTNASFSWTTEPLENTGKLITKPSILRYNWTTEPLENIGKLITKPEQLVFSWTTIKEDESYQFEMGFIVGPDCKSLTILDENDYTAIGEVRSSFDLSVVLKNVKTNETVTVTPNSSNATLVTQWDAVITEDGIYEASLYDGVTFLMKEFVLINCAGNNCVLKESQILKDEIESGRCKNGEKLEEVMALNNLLIARFKSKEFNLALRLIEEFQNMCSC